MSAYKSPEYHEKKIRNAVGWFVVGCFAFMAVEVAMIYVAVLTFTHPELDWPSSFVILGIGGLILLWQMVVSATFRTSLPERYKEIDYSNNVRLVRIVNEVTSILKLCYPHRIYTTNGLDAAVFCRPSMLSIFKKPKQELVIGSIVLDTLSDDELRAVLYHEFGHYSSKSLDKKIPTYIVAQFSRSFTAIKQTEKPGVWKNIIQSQVALFSYFAFWICGNIDRHYACISLNEEYNADDVATHHISKSVFCQTLVKMAVLQYNYRYMLWAIRQLQPTKYKVTSSELLSLCRANTISSSAIPTNVKLRVNRFLCNTTEAVTHNVFNPITYHPYPLVLKLVASHIQYVEAMALRKSVQLTLHLDRRKHRLPLIEGKYKILLDGKPIGEGNFIKGFDITAKTHPGKHTVSIFAVSGIFPIPYEFECRRGDKLRLDMDFKVHIKNGYYDIFVASAKNMNKS